MLNPFRRTTLSARQERAVQRTLQQLRQQRRQRFRILACIDGSEESFITVRFAARLAPTDDCDIIVLNVRPVDQGLWSGGLQVRLARQNMLDADCPLASPEDMDIPICVNDGPSIVKIIRQHHAKWKKRSGKAK